MIYPQKPTSKKSEKILKILLSISVIIAIILVIINKITTPEIHWAALANCGIIYIWITAMYSIKKSTNVAAHVLMQTIAISVVCLYIDKTIGQNGWAINIAIPIILIIANITMLILTVISYKKYIKYAICQVMIVLISLIPMILMIKKTIEPNLLNQIAVIISIISLIVSLILSYKDIKDAIIRKIHM